MGNGSSMDNAKVVYFDFSGRKEKVTSTHLFSASFVYSFKICRDLTAEYSTVWLWHGLYITFRFVQGISDSDDDDDDDDDDDGVVVVVVVGGGGGGNSAPCISISLLYRM